VTGVASSADFPERNPLQACVATGHTDAFVTKLNAWGNGLLYSTCLGGSGYDYGTAIAVDSAATPQLPATRLPATFRSPTPSRRRTPGSTTPLWRR